MLIEKHPFALLPLQTAVSAWKAGEVWFCCIMQAQSGTRALSSGYCGPDHRNQAGFGNRRGVVPGPVSDPMAVAQGNPRRFGRQLSAFPLRYARSVNASRMLREPIGTCVFRISCTVPYTQKPLVSVGRPAAPITVQSISCRSLLFHGTQTMLWTVKEERTPGWRPEKEQYHGAQM